MTCCELGSAGRPAFFNPLRRPAFEPGGELALLIIGQSRRCANRIFNPSPRPVAEIWKALPKDLPPRSTVWEYLDLWDWDGTLARIHHALYVEVREKAGREASPTTAIIDSQSAKGAVKGGLRSTRPAMTLARRCVAASATS